MTTVHVNPGTAVEAQKPTAPAPNESPKAILALGAVSADIKNFILLVMEALQKNNESESKIQVIDANMAMDNINEESAVYSSFNSQLSQASGAVENAAKNDTSGSGDQNAAVTAAQSGYNVLSSKANSVESQFDSKVQAAQAQVQNDSNNVSAAAQNGTTFLQMLQTLLGAMAGIVSRS